VLGEEKWTGGKTVQLDSDSKRRMADVASADGEERERVPRKSGKKEVLV